MGEGKVVSRLILCFAITVPETRSEARAKFFELEMVNKGSSCYKLG